MVNFCFHHVQCCKIHNRRQETKLLCQEPLRALDPKHKLGFWIKSWISHSVDGCERPGSVQAREMHPVWAARLDLDPSCRCSINSVILPRRSFIFNMNYHWLLSALTSDYRSVCQTLTKILPLWTSLQCVRVKDESSPALDILFLYLSNHSEYINWEKRPWSKYLHLLYRLIALSAKSRLMVCRFKGWIPSRFFWTAHFPKPSSFFNISYHAIAFPEERNWNAVC